ncbi:hypothetical protein LY12_004736 [Prauserella alba]|nr:hypothetical protein [Prauserella alba]
MALPGPRHLARPGPEGHAGPKKAPRGTFVALNATKVPLGASGPLGAPHADDALSGE